MRPSSVLITATLAVGLAVAMATQGLAAGSLSVSPAIVEHVAAKGAVGGLTVANSTGKALKVTVTTRPWVQSRATGVVTPDRKHTLTSTVSASARTFTLANGENRVAGLTLRKTPSSHSVYGAIEVVGLPTKKATNGVTTGYRLVSSLRLNPTSSQRRFKLQIGSPRVAGSGAARAVLVGVRNSGNTIEPISGSATLKGPGTSLNVTIAPRRILPGGIVDVRLRNTAGMQKGRYTVTTKLSQGGKPRKTNTSTVRVS